MFSTKGSPCPALLYKSITSCPDSMPKWVSNGLDPTQSEKWDNSLFHVASEQEPDTSATPDSVAKTVVTPAQSRCR